jgi:hypothetical protein
MCSCLMFEATFSICQEAVRRSDVEKVGNKWDMLFATSRLVSKTHKNVNNLGANCCASPRRHCTVMHITGNSHAHYSTGHCCTPSLGNILHHNCKHSPVAASSQSSWLLSTVVSPLTGKRTCWLETCLYSWLAFESLLCAAYSDCFLSTYHSFTCERHHMCRHAVLEE